MSDEHLNLEVASHIVQDLGLNLYTSLPRVLVEFVANSHDADSPGVDVQINIEQIASERRKLRQQHEDDLREMSEKPDPDIVPLEARTLPGEVRIVIEDRGHGMSRDDLQEKFLRVGRRRREEDGPRSPGGRILMGRKGLGKLAGFGVAHRIEVLSRKQGEKTATEIVLDYERLIEKKRAIDVRIPVRTLEDVSNIEPHGTRVTLSKLVYDPAKSHLSTIAKAIGQHFYLTGTDFTIRINGKDLEPPEEKFVYAFPEPSLPFDQFVPCEYTSEDGRRVSFSYRVRFTGKGKQLAAAQRGVRIYAHGRLASPPDLLDARTGIHGFRNTHYLDAIAHADFIDDQHEDYIATNRHSLRWESPLLEPMRATLTSAMEESCAAYQKVRDEKAEDEVKNDAFTADLIANAKLAKHRERLAIRVAKSYSSVCEDGLQGQEYKDRMTIFVDGLGQGDLLKTLRDIAVEDNPDFQKLVAEVTELTARELGDFMKYVEGRLSGIEALRKLCANVDFKEHKNEDELHVLLRGNPWLIDPTFTQFLTSNEAEKTMQVRLAKELKIGPHVPNDYDPTVPDEAEPGGKNKRPDLVSLISNDSLNRLIVVELKAPNTPLYGSHLRQLQNYMRRSKKWLQERGYPNYLVQGYLIGSFGPVDSKAEDVEWLRDQIQQTRNEGAWRVFDILEILNRTMQAHHELVNVYNEDNTGSE